MAGFRWIYVVCLWFGPLSSILALESFSLNGDWTVVNSNGTLNLSGKVPGSIYTDLINAGLLGDPYYAFNDVHYRWVSYEDWAYAKTFDVPATLLQYSNIQLHLHGVDTLSTIRLNDQLVGSTDNMFIRYQFNIKQMLKSQGNKLEVQFKSPVKSSADLAHAYPYVVPPACPGDFQHGECNVDFIRKEQCSFSWDWGPAFPTMGIWKNISMDGFNTFEMYHVTVMTEKASDGTWTVSGDVFFSVYIDSSQSSIDMILNVTIPGLASIQNTVTLKNGEERVSYTLKVPKEVEVWWPNGFGNQPLYHLEVNAIRAKDAQKREIRFGFRTIELVQNKLSGTIGGRTFYFKINGLPIFMRGSNWIPADSFQERITETYLRKLLLSAKLANMNMLRVWGGGIYESDMFYDIADEYGIMIWQDFMFACSMYPSDQHFLDNVKEENIHQVKRLQHHPSIAIWAGNNENEAALRQNWYPETKKNFSLYYEDYKKLYIDTIMPVVKDLDKSRPYVPSSPSNGIETEEEGWVAKNPQSTLYGDVHHYDYASDMWIWEVFPITRFTSEYGIQSWPSMTNLAQVTKLQDLTFDSDFVKQRQHHPDGNEQLVAALSMHWTTEGIKRDFATFAYLTQINQAMGIKTETEVYRRYQSELTDKNEGMTMGALYWQLQDIWQAPTWASIEYGGTWKMLHYYAKKFFASTLISPYIKGNDVIVYYIEDQYDEIMIDKANQKNDLQFTKTGQSGRKHENDILSSKSYRESQISKGKEQTVSLFNLTIACHKWNQLAPLKVWSYVLPKPKAVSGMVLTESLMKIMNESACPDGNHCFLHFSINGDIYMPSNILLLSNFTTAVGLTVPNIKIARLTAITDKIYNIDLLTDQVALFVWLEAPGIPGYFSDNGFFMVQPTISIKFTAWPEYTGDMDKFEKVLTVTSMMNKYQP